jgi:hypothetical protein
LFSVLLDNGVADRALPLRRYPDQSYDSSVRATMDDGQLSEIFIECDENSTLAMGLGNDFVVPRIRFGDTNVLGVMS